MGMPRKEVTVRRNWVVGAWEPMSNKRNGLGQCKVTEVKNFVKAVMETWSCEYGFIF